MSVADQLARLRPATASVDQFSDLASAALAEGEEETALAIIAPAARVRQAATLWQWKALLHRSLDDHEAALAAFDEAVRIDPASVSIAHGLARTALEAGRDARLLYGRARGLGPPNGEILIGQAAARAAMGEGEEAAAELASILDRVPMWLDGHRHLAQLRAFLGAPERADESLHRALADQPSTSALWQTLFDLQARRSDFAALDRAVAEARAHAIDLAMCDDHEAIAAAELGDAGRADALFARLEQGASSSLAIWQIRHLLRSGQAARALPLIDRELVSDRAAYAWPYAALAWRLTGDARWQWLDDPRLVQRLDLREVLPPLPQVADLLCGLHAASGQYLDQSVRDGTQTDGPLLSRLEPELRATRAAILAAVSRYVAALPPPDPRHPFLSQRRNRRLRMAGSWSVRLTGGGGRHANHVHPLGWISSALYIALPDREDGYAGWLSLGAPQEGLGLALAPQHWVEPRVGQLVLFPSYMWHGTEPFESGERLTIAFDIAPPR